MKKPDSIQRGCHPLVSIVLFTYNSAKYVREALESAKGQTYRDIELVISDDGSKDDTIRICETWLEKNTRRFVRSEILAFPCNTGISSNCNRGFQSANGEWIQAVAGDDILTENCVELKIEFVRKNPDTRVLFSKLVNFKDDDRDMNALSISPEYPNRFFNESITAREQYQALLLNDQVGNSPTFFVKKSALADVGWYDTRIRPGGDYQMWLKMAGAGMKLSFLDRVTVKYRSHPDATFNFPGSWIVRPHAINYERIKEEHCYRHYNTFYYCKSRYLYRVNRMFYNSPLNRDTKVNRFLYQLATRQLNPFRFGVYLAKLAGFKPTHIKR